jgi:hypothetical protein
MPTLVGTRKKVHPKPEPKEETQVVKDVGLDKLLSDWDQSAAKAHGYFIRIVEYCHENDISNKQLQEGLMRVRGMNEGTARNQAAKILKAAHIDEVTERLDSNDPPTETEIKHIIGGYKRVGPLEYVKLDGKDRPEPEEVLGKLLFKLISRFIDELGIEQGEFVQQVKRVYKDAYTKLKAKAEKDEESEEEEGEQEE